MERRVLIAIFLSFLVLYGYQALFVKPVPKPPSGQTATPGVGKTPAKGPAASTPTPATANPLVTTPAAAAGGTASARITEPSERDMSQTRESGLHFIAAGHYATETFGVRALYQNLAARGLLTAV